MNINKITLTFFIYLWASQSAVAVASVSVEVIRNLKNIAAKVENGGSLNNADGDALFEAGKLTLNEAGIGDVKKLMNHSEKNREGQQVNFALPLSSKSRGYMKGVSSQARGMEASSLSVLQDSQNHYVGIQPPSLSQASKGIVKKVLKNQPITSKECNRLVDVNENILNRYSINKSELMSRVFSNQNDKMSSDIDILGANGVPRLSDQEHLTRKSDPHDVKQSSRQPCPRLSAKREKQRILGKNTASKKPRAESLVKSLAPFLLSGALIDPVKDKSYAVNERLVNNGNLQVFTGFDKGMNSAKKSMKEADIVYLAIGAGDDRDQICPEFLEEAAHKGQKVLVVTVDKNGRGSAPKNKNITHIHINDYIHKAHVAQFDALTPRQKLLVFDGTIAIPDGDRRCCDFTKELLTKGGHKKNNRICWIQTLGVVEDGTELASASQEADNIGREYRRSNKGNGHGKYSLNHASGQRQAYQQVKGKLGILNHESMKPH